MKQIIVPKGCLFYFTEGAYSDFGVHGHFIALDDLTKEGFDQGYDEVEVSLEDDEKMRWNGKEKWINWLIRKGKIMVLSDIREIYLGDYEFKKEDIRHCV